MNGVTQKTVLSILRTIQNIGLVAFDATKGVYLGHEDGKPVFRPMRDIPDAQAIPVFSHEDTLYWMQGFSAKEANALGQYPI